MNKPTRYFLISFRTEGTISLYGNIHYSGEDHPKYSELKGIISENYHGRVSRCTVINIHEFKSKKDFQLYFS